MPFRKPKTEDMKETWHLSSRAEVLVLPQLEKIQEIFDFNEQFLGHPT